MDSNDVDAPSFAQEPAPPPGAASPRSRPPTGPRPQEVGDAIVRLADVGPQIDDLHRIATEVHNLTRRADQPAWLHPIALTAANWKVTDDSEPSRARSIGLLNPTGITVYLGVGGVPAEPGRRAIPVPPTSMIVLPLGVDTVEVGAAQADVAAADAIVFLFRFESVQPMFLGAL